MIEADQERRRITEVLLPRVEEIVQNLRMDGVTDLHAATRRLLSDDLGDLSSYASTIRMLRALATLNSNGLVVESALREAFALVVSLS
jgi:hypothetical protein